MFTLPKIKEEEVLMKMFFSRIGKGFLWPGDFLCDVFNVHETDNRQVLRMFLNLVIYSKVVGLILYWIAM